MKSADIKRLAKKIRIKSSAVNHDRILTDAEAVLLKSRKNGSKVSRPDLSIWRIIMKSRITKLGAVAVIIVIVAVIVGIHYSDGSVQITSVAWGQVIEAFNNAPCVHYTETRVSNDATIRKKEAWFEEGLRLRQEYEDKIIIDDGSHVLTLNKQKRTADLRESTGRYQDLVLSTVLRAFLVYEVEPDGRLVDSPVPGLSRSLLPEPSIDGVLVYRFAAGSCRGEARVNAETRLPLRITGEILHDYDDYRPSARSVPVDWSCAVSPDEIDKFEVVFDYEPIPDEIFSTAIPDGYTVEH